jgi:antirestriction protein ArdC
MTQRLSAQNINAKAEAFFDAVGAMTRHGRRRAYYSPAMDYISMPPFESFENAESYYAMRAHECVHWARMCQMPSLRPMCKNMPPERAFQAGSMYSFAFSTWAVACS